MHVRNQLVTPPLCRVCTLWQQPAPAEFRIMPKGPLIRDDLCRHLGEVIELRRCATCRGDVKIKIFACRHPDHQETTLAHCQECPDYAWPSDDSMRTEGNERHKSLTKTA
jgi:hypothetical protein